MAGAYEISCPDSQCPKEGIFLLDEIEKIVGKELSDKYKGFRLNTGQYISNRCLVGSTDQACSSGFYILQNIHTCGSSKFQFGVFFLCSPNCLKQPIYKFFYPIISCRIFFSHPTWRKMFKDLCMSDYPDVISILSKKTTPLTLNL